MMLSRSLVRLGSLVLVACAAACVPATQFASVAVDYHASPNIDVQMDRVAGSAVAYADKDIFTLDRAGAVYLGELDVEGIRGDLPAGGAGPANLSGRASLEAAQRGATHFMLISGGVGSVTTGENVIVTRHAVVAYPDKEQEVTARYALVRVDPSRWPELPATLRPNT